MPEFQYEDAKAKTFSLQTRQAIEKELYRLLDEISCEENPLSHREHLGTSVIGDPCARKLWYSFRWVKLEYFDGRMRRLFKRGHMEEEKIITILTHMGFYIRNIDVETNKQYQFSKVNGHYGGSSDSLALLPWFRKDDDARVLCEYKTHNLKSFTKLKESKSVKLAKPKHYAQMCGYGREFKALYALYCAVCKDNDDIYFEFLELDWNYGIQLEKKAEDIINAYLPPPRISDNPAYTDCKYCHFASICHNGDPVEVNCRSCKFAQPIENGKWFCHSFKQEIPLDFIKQGCPSHVSINQ